MTTGTSVIAAYPICSCISEKPGPDVAVMALRPPTDAPIQAARLAISSSIWINFPPTLGSSLDNISAISVEGVIGYPA
jgi:hypothetical protein